MTTKPRIAIVIGSTRPGRYADKAAGWMLKQTKARDDIEAELLDPNAGIVREIDGATIGRASRIASRPANPYDRVR
jgi:NADPH-dependent FMN reductase